MALATEAQLKKAREVWEHHEGIQIDDGAEVSEADDCYWVQAWVLVEEDDDGS